MKTFPYADRLKGKLVVITGASSGVGRAAALAFARSGASLVLAARRDEAIAALATECREMGSNAIAVPTDVTEYEAMRNLARTAKQFGGKIDVWVNNAGVLAAGRFEDTPIEVHSRVIDINLMGYLHGAHAVMPYFKEQEYGILINNISVGGWMPVPYGVGYSASKFGLRGYSEALRGELIKWPDIHVCDLFPPFLDTPGIQHAANYTGVILKPAPPVFDPLQVALQMVKLAINPESSTVSITSNFIRLAHAIMPAFTRFVTAKLIEGYMKVADPVPPTTGNLFQSPAYGTSVHGGWDLPMDSRKKSLTAALMLGGIAALLLLKNQNNGKK